MRREDATRHIRTEHFFKTSEGRMKNYIIPEIGSYLLVALSTRIIQNWIFLLKSKIGIPLSENTKNKILQTFTYAT